ncbi:hypothetical protein BaRGS_00027578 [Batillaria attramentaria]|uniref:DUF4536 domain-containing protein n=1 Tax=Batillaria attramentaria TaxID=370345 RepID=A0ABD0K165_9CAEN
MMEPVREMVLRVVPLAEGDCLSCKLIGTGACWGMSVIVALSYRRIAAQYTGFRRKVFAAYVVSLITALARGVHAAMLQRGQLMNGGHTFRATDFPTQALPGMTLLGTARLFDMSFFEKPSDPDGKRKSLQDLVREDFDSLHKLMSRFSQPQASAAPTVQTDVGGKKDE